MALEQFIQAENIAQNLPHDKNLIKSMLWMKLFNPYLRKKINNEDIDTILKSNILSTVLLDLTLNFKNLV